MSRLFRRRRPDQQGVFGFVSRMERRDRQFRAAIVLLTAFAILAIIASSPVLRSRLSIAGSEVVKFATSQIRNLVLVGTRTSTASTRPLSDEEWKARRDLKVLDATRALESFYASTTPAIRSLFDAAGMSPGAGLNRWGRGDQVFMFSSQVFQEDGRGRSYRLRPNARSVWLRELVLKGGPHGLLLVPDRPDVRDLASKAGAIVVEDSFQNTNSWGLRGPEPDLDAGVRLLILGDSYMQGMFIGDDQTPPVLLETYLEREWECPVGVLNTGHVGYSPEQYYYTYLEYVDRFRPHFVVISVCHNDFGDDGDVLLGKSESLYAEAAYWLEQIIENLRGKNIGFLLVPVPHEQNVDFFRPNGHYPGRLFDFISLSPRLTISLLDDFIDENLRLKRDEPAKFAGSQTSVLYNASIKDGHFSSLGSELWAKTVGKRITRVLDPTKLPRLFFEAGPAASQPTGAESRPAGGSPPGGPP